MSVYKPAKSRFFCFDFQFKGNRYHGSTGCTGRRDAEEYERRERRLIALGRDAKPAITIDKACGLWHEARGKYLANRDTDFAQLLRLTQRLGANVPIGELTMTMIDGYIARRRAEVKNASVNREIMLLRRVVRWLDARGYAVPALNWGALRLPEPKERIRELSAEEEQRLFAALPVSLRGLVEFALLSGQRKAEIINLRWQDVDLEAARAFTIAKGGLPHSFPLTPRMVAIISSQPRVLTTDRVFTYECERAAPPKMVNGVPLPRRYKGRRYPFTLYGWARKWKKALEDAGISDYTFHDNRHTKATRALRASGNLKAVQKLLNHADIRTTARYAHAMEDDIRAVMAASESRNSPEPVTTGSNKSRKKQGTKS